MLVLNSRNQAYPIVGMTGEIPFYDEEVIPIDENCGILCNTYNNEGFVPFTAFTVPEVGEDAFQNLSHVWERPEDDPLRKLVEDIGIYASEDGDCHLFIDGSDGMRPLNTVHLNHISNRLEDGSDEILSSDGNDILGFEVRFYYEAGGKEGVIARYITRFAGDYVIPMPNGEDKPVLAHKITYHIKEKGGEEYDQVHFVYDAQESPADNITKKPLENALAIKTDQEIIPTGDVALTDPLQNVIQDGINGPTFLLDVLEKVKAIKDIQLRDKFIDMVALHMSSQDNQRILELQINAGQKTQDGHLQVINTLAAGLIKCINLQEQQNAALAEQIGAMFNLNMDQSEIFARAVQEVVQDSYTYCIEQGRTSEEIIGIFAETNLIGNDLILECISKSKDMDEALVKVLSLFAGIFGEGTIDIVNQAFNMAGTGQIITGEIANQALKTARRLGMGAFDSANHQSDNSLLGLIESLGFAGDVNKRSIDLASNSINGSQALAMLLAANGKSS